MATNDPNSARGLTAGYSAFSSHAVFLGNFPCFPGKKQHAPGSELTPKVLISRTDYQIGGVHLVSELKGAGHWASGPAVVH